MSDFDLASRELLNPEVFERYTLRDPREISAMFRTLHKQRPMLTAYIGRGPDFFLTALLDVDHTHRLLILDGSPDDALNAKACEVDRLTCTAMVEGVRLQFEVADIDPHPHDGLDALCTRFPESLIRLQRRAFFRVDVPLNSALSCTLNEHSEGGGEVIEHTTRVANLSARGIGLILPETCEFELDHELDGMLTLPEQQAMPITLRIRNTFETQAPNGTTQRRLGCEFINLDTRLEALIQRYLFQSERERRMLEPD